MRKILLTLTFITLCAVPAYSQDTQLQRACEQCVDALRLVTAERDSLREQLRLSQEENALLQRLAQIERERGDHYKTASEARAEANNIDGVRVQMLRDQIADYRLQLERANREIERLRSRHKWYFLGGVAAGATSSRLRF